MSTRDDLLHVYLRDHLAGATGGLALARRLADEHRDTSAAGDLAQFARDIEADRVALIQIMHAVGARQATVKPVLAAMGERLGRLKLNGALFRRSPLSAVMELEMMRMGVQGKRSGWRTVREIAATDPRIDLSQLDALIVRAEEQAALLDELHLGAAVEALLD